MERIVSVKAVYDYLAGKSYKPGWRKGVRDYAVDLLNDLMERYPGATINVNESGWRKSLEKGLMNGCDSWEQYSDGSTLCYSYDICERLCTEKQRERFDYGGKWPRSNFSWIDLQEAALRQAFQLIIKTAIKLS